MKWFGSGLALLAAAGVTALLVSAQAADIVVKTRSADFALTGSEVTTLANILGAHWPGRVSEVDGVLFERAAAPNQTTINGAAVGCYTLSDAQIDAELAAGNSVDTARKCTSVTWTLSAGEKAAIGALAARMWGGAASTILELHCKREGAAKLGWVVGLETLSPSAARARAKTGPVTVVGVVQ